jgi:anti-anti-sigma factor
MPSESPSFEITESREDGRVRVRLQGELDLATAGQVADRLDELRTQHARVLLDLDQLEFIDSTGIRVVLLAARSASRDGWELSVTRGSAVVRRVFALVGLEGQLPVDDDRG